MGKHALISSNEKMVHGGFMLDVTPKINADFLNESMNTDWYKRFISLKSLGGNGSISNLKASDLENEILLIPNEKEQEKIDILFNILNKIIDSNEDKQNLNQINKNKNTIAYSKIFRFEAKLCSQKNIKRKDLNQ